MENGNALWFKIEPTVILPATIESRDRSNLWQNKQQIEKKLCDYLCLFYQSSENALTYWWATAKEIFAYNFLGNACWDQPQQPLDIRALAERILPKI